MNDKLISSTANLHDDEKRYYCPLAPCIQGWVVSPSAYGGRSFATLEAYYRHLEQGHFIPRVNAPAPYVAGERTSN